MQKSYFTKKFKKIVKLLDLIYRLTNFDFYIFKYHLKKIIKLKNKNS